MPSSRTLSAGFLYLMFSSGFIAQALVIPDARSEPRGAVQFGGAALDILQRQVHTFGFSSLDDDLDLSEDPSDFAIIPLVSRAVDAGSNVDDIDDDEIANSLRSEEAKSPHKQSKHGKGKKHDKGKKHGKSKEARSPSHKSHDKHGKQKGDKHKAEKPKEARSAPNKHHNKHHKHKGDKGKDAEPKKTKQ